MGSIEQEIELAILAQKRWADLDNRMRDLIGGSQEYDKKILKYSIENQLRYRGNLVRFIVNKEYDYYEELLKYSRDHLMLFPYHLSDFIITGMRITPFQYYRSTMTQILVQERSYDTLPNFTAADCLILLNIGRNQYIDIMNELRSTYRKFLGINMRRNAQNAARELLPKKPHKDVPIEPWWLVNPGYITEDDIRSMVTPAERSIIDRLFTHDGLSNQILACDLDEVHVRSLYLKGLIYLDVPIYDDDFIVVPPLEGFVMNRVTGDYFETLLYKIFISIDQSTPVKELAKILEIDTQLVKNAVSMYCRLKFAYKKYIYIDMEKCHPSWREHLNRYQEMGINVSQQSKPSKHLTNFISELASFDDHDHGVEVFDMPAGIESSYNLNEASTETCVESSMVHSQSVMLSPHQLSSIQPPSNSTKKIALFYDSNLAAFLMMGNLSSKLKNHAVTMFEVGKLSDEWIDSLLDELAKIKSDALEDDGYEARRYYIHALMLHRTIEFIRTDLRLATCLLKSDDGGSPDGSRRIGLDLIRVESLSNLNSEACERFLKKNYQLIISIAPLNQDVKLNAATSLPHLGPGSPIINSLWFRLYIYHVTGCGPPSLLLIQGYRLTELPEVFLQYESLIINHWNREPTFVSIKSALNIINDALTHSPLLVQAYPIQPLGGNLINSEEKVFVPLPLIADSGSITSSHVQTSEQTSEEEPRESVGPGDAADLNLERDPAVISLSKHLDLRRICGFITLLRSTESVKRLIEQNEASSMYGSKRRTESTSPSLLGAATDSTSQNEAPAGDDKQTVASSQSSQNKEEKFTLFDCHLGIPLFDRFLNKQVRNRISSQSLCGAESLNELVGLSRHLNEKIGSFVNEFRTNRDLDSIDSSNFGDQRHFFAFPETEQFRCSIPRPAENLLFHGGKLSIFRPAT